MADRTSAALFASIFDHMAGFNKNGPRTQPTRRDRAFALEIWKQLGEYDFSYYQMGCDDALEILGLARRDPENKDRWSYGPVETKNKKKASPNKDEEDPLKYCGSEFFQIPESNLWSHVCWPLWVPEKLRQQIEDFWCASMGRGPKEWIASCSTPRFGEIVSLPLLIGSQLEEGRFVHRWNNLGAVVRTDGKWFVVSS